MDNCIKGCWLSLKRCLAFACFVFVVAFLVAFIIMLVQLFRTDDTPEKSSYSSYPYDHAVVAADNGTCSDLGRDILKKNGSAVDAAITVMFCLGVLNMHSSGIGGGGFMLVYKRGSQKAEVIDFREEAPAAAYKTMYTNTRYSSKVGPSASGVPGEVKGYYTAWKRHGNLNWTDLVQPVINLLYRDVKLGTSTYKAVESNKDAIKYSSGLREIFMNNGKFLGKGDLMDYSALIKIRNTLEIIRDNPDDFYTGKLAQQIVQDIQNNGGIITLQDMRDYDAKVRPALGNKLGDDYQWYSVPPPGSGAVLGMILNILQGYHMDRDGNFYGKYISRLHRIIEAFKFSYAWQPLLGDMDFENVAQTVNKMIDLKFAESIRDKINDEWTYNSASHYGGVYSQGSGSTTTHASIAAIIAPNGDAVAVTSSINAYFGCKFRSNVTGIIMNNQMDDFSMPGKETDGVPPSPANFIKARKRPLSSASPIIILDKNGKVRMVTGASSGGTAITTSTAQVVMNYLWFGRTLEEAIDDSRIHHQLIPMYVQQDSRYKLDPSTVDTLKRYNHIFSDKTFTAVLQAVARGDDGRLYGESDPRKESYFGLVSGF